jgi:hypothetical protein
MGGRDAFDFWTCRQLCLNITCSVNDKGNWTTTDCPNLAPRAGLPGINSANGLDRQTYSRSNLDPQRLSGAVANPRAPGV